MATTSSRAASSASGRSVAIRPLGRCPCRGGLEQSDATGWMAAYCLLGIDMALELERATTRGLRGASPAETSEHFASISTAMTSQGLWDDADGFFYDKLTGAGRGRS